MIRAVIFDLGNVLVNFDAKRAAKRFAKACGIPVWRVWVHFFTSSVEKSYTCGKISSREFFEHSKQALGFPKDFQTFKKIWNGIFWENRGMLRIMTKLRPHYRLYLISNTNEMHFSFIKKKYKKLIRLFHQTFPSNEVGFRKPDPEIYRAVLKKIKLKPETTVFIDDMPSFVSGARKVGMNAIRFKNPKQMIQELRKFKIKI